MMYVIYASIFLFFSYVSLISTYVIDPLAQLKSGQALKGCEREQKESNKIKLKYFTK